MSQGTPKSKRAYEIPADLKSMDPRLFASLPPIQEKKPVVPRQLGSQKSLINSQNYSSQDRQEMISMIKKIKKNRRLLAQSPSKFTGSQKVILNLMTYNQDVDQLLVKQTQMKAKDRKTKVKTAERSKSPTEIEKGFENPKMN